MIKVNFGCFKSNIEGWIGVDKALRHLVVSRIPLLSLILYKIGIFNLDQYKWHKQGLFKSVRFGNVAKKLKFKSSSVDFIYSSHMLEHLFRDEAVFFLAECYRILKLGGLLRICLPCWELERTKESFSFSGFAINKHKLKISHKWLWSFNELRDLLTNIGFVMIDKFDFKEGNFPDLKLLEHRKGLIVQAKK